MSVPKVFSGLTDLASQLKHGESARIKAAAAKATAAVQSLAPSATAAMRDILSNYNMTDITPGDFSKIVQQMSQRGAISQQDAQELSSIRVDLENAGVNPDQSVNLVQFYQQQLAKAQAASAQSSNPAAPSAAVNALVARLNWVQKLAAMSQSGASGVNTVA